MRKTSPVPSSAGWAVPETVGMKKGEPVTRPAGCRTLLTALPASTSHTCGDYVCSSECKH